MWFGFSMTGVTPALAVGQKRVARAPLRRSLDCCPCSCFGVLHLLGHREPHARVWGSSSACRVCEFHSAAFPQSHPPGEVLEALRSVPHPSCTPPATELRVWTEAVSVQCPGGLGDIWPRSQPLWTDF